MNSIPVLKFDQVSQQDVIIIPYLKKERKKTIKYLIGLESQPSSSWLLEAIKLVREQSLEQHKSIIQYVGKNRIALIAIDESANYQKIALSVRTILFKLLATQEQGNAVCLIPSFLKTKTIAALSNGVSMAYMRVNYFRTDRKDDYGSFYFLTDKGKSVSDPLIDGLTVAEVQKDICRLVNLPSNEKNPLYIVNWAKDKFNKRNIFVEILDTKGLLQHGLGALLAVGKGSKTPPYLMVLTYDPKIKGKQRHIGLIGKGVTFDTGGISLKDPMNMHLMKSDMGGAAAVLGTMDIIEKLKMNVKVTAVIPLAENAIGPDAYRPGDVISSLNGKSIEVIDTDAEGRLILADAITYMLHHHKPEIMIDLATLTGSVIMTLGYKAAGMFTNNDDLAKAMTKAADSSGERVWRLPLWDEYEDEMNSDIADIKNLATKPVAGAITAAKFLQAFTEKHPAWVHLDIAGVAMMDSDFSKQRSATAYGVLLLKQYIEDLIK